jgi:predicted Zn-dependent protease with MMP-like domain
MKPAREKFENIVDSGIQKIPERFLQLMDNVAIIVEDEPSAEQRKKSRLGRGWVLFGLYEGVPLSRRGGHYTAVIPDKITIFKRPIEQAARDRQDMEEIVKNTVWHEIAHHFGLDERRVREAERRRQQNK